MKKFLITIGLFFIALGVSVQPTYAFSSINFNVSDSATNQPWGTVAGQKYRIYIQGSVSGALLDTGTLTTPADPVLSFSCSYGADCVGAPFGTPVAGELVRIYIILTGTSGLPETIVRSFEQPATDSGAFVINANTGTGPTAVALSSTAVASQNTMMMSATIAVFLTIMTMGAVYKKRQPAPVSFL